jgi:hypothetical protein
LSAYTIPNVVAQHPRGDRIMDVYSQLLTERIVYLGTAVDPGVANTLIAQLIHLEAASAEQEINLYINCDGGDLPSMLAIYDTMQYIEAPVATTCVGQAIGVGAVLLAAGTPGRRALLPSAPARAAIISLDGSLRPRSISERYCGERPARPAVSASVSSRSWRSARRRRPSTSRQRGSGADGWGSRRSGTTRALSAMPPA